MFPHLAMHLATNVDRMLTYLLLYHETAVANLLEVSTERLDGRYHSLQLGLYNAVTSPPTFSFHWRRLWFSTRLQWGTLCKRDFVCVCRASFC